MPATASPVIFDLDGTVWDSAPGIVSSMSATLAELGLPDPGVDAIGGMLGPPLLAMLSGLGVPDDLLDDARIVYRRHYRDHGEFDCRVYDGITELLDALRAAGHRTATATSKGVEAVERMLVHFDLRDRFDIVEAASMTQRGHDKIDIIGAAMAGLDALGAPATASTMVGDRIYDITGGRHYGLRTIGVRWGYAPAGELDSAGASNVADTVADLRELVVGPTQ